MLYALKRILALQLSSKQLLQCNFMKIISIVEIPIMYHGTDLIAVSLSAAIWFPLTHCAPATPP